MSSPLVSLINASKQYRELVALNSVTMHLNHGEVMGLFGHNGAGKTTMMKLILGVISPSSGQVEVMGIAPDSKKAWQYRSKVGYLPENVSFYEQLTGLEALTYFAKLKGFRGSLLGKASSQTNITTNDKTHDKANIKVKGKSAKQYAITLLEQVGITHAMTRPIKTYSKGMRQRLGLAQAFIGSPRLLLLDEPTVGLDPIATRDFYQTVKQLKSTGSSVILCSHVLPGVEQHIDRAMVLSSGQLLGMGTLAELRQQADLPVAINIAGLDSKRLEGLQLSRYTVNNDSSRLFVPEQNKLAVLKQLLSDENLTDLQVESAGLEQVYHHLLDQDVLGANSSIALSPSELSKQKSARQTQEEQR